MVKRLWRNEGVEKRGRPNEYRDSLNRVPAVTFKTETLGPCKILAHIPLKKATSGASMEIARKFAPPLSRSRDHPLEDEPPFAAFLPRNN